MGQEKLFVKDVLNDCPIIYNLDEIPESCMICVKIENKGKGMIAIRNIMKGEILLREKATMNIPDIEDWPKVVREEFEKLSNETQQIIFNLPNAFPPITISGQKISSRGLIGIFHTNSLYANGKCLLFLQISKFNHSCNYNVEHVYYPPFAILTAKRDIMKGEELCITYLIKSELRRNTEYRQKELLETFNFMCKCERCVKNQYRKVETKQKQNHDRKKYQRKICRNITLSMTKKLKVDEYKHPHLKSDSLGNKPIRHLPSSVWKILLVLSFCFVLSCLIHCTNCLCLFKLTVNYSICIF